MIRYLMILMFIFLKFDLSFGDEPPSWRPYKVFSQNKKYFCWIDLKHNDTSKYFSDKIWVLKVFKKDSSLIWQKDYQHTGYTEGLLSDDGNKFIYLEFWSYKDAPSVKVIRKNQPDLYFSGKDFHILRIFLQQTVSHNLWLEKYTLENDNLTIYTRDGRVWLINLENGKKDFVGFNFNGIHLIIGFIFILLIILTIIVIKRKKKTTTTNQAL